MLINSFDCRIDEKIVIFLQGISLYHFKTIFRKCKEYWFLSDSPQPRDLQNSDFPLWYHLPLNRNLFQL